MRSAPLPALARRVCAAGRAAVLLALVGDGGGAAAEAWHVAWHEAAIDRLDRAVERYGALAAGGGWPQVPAGPTLRPGIADPRIALLRRRLEVTGDLPPAAAADAAFGGALEAGVRSFQARHGLLVDGLVGPETLAALNVPAETRSASLRLNLARIRAFEPWGPSYVLVNIPGYEARLVSGPGVALESRVVVGRRSWPTPTLSAEISRIVVNPAWTVPARIQSREMIPRARRDPGYLGRQNIRVYSGWGPGARRLDPAAVDWSGAAAQRYRLRQDPGPGNALGELKFLFENAYAVYLHDTPAKGLFDRPARSFSHGCIRIERPHDLARLLLDGQEGWDAAALEAAIASGRTQEIALERPVPIHLVYWTAWVDEAGRVQFRKDVYGRDRLVSSAAGGGPGRTEETGPALACDPTA